MTIVRGSTQKLIVIQEATFGVTPATPVMAEVLLTQLQKKSTQTVLRSGQIRSHPFVDRLMYGRFVHDLSIDFELQINSHDTLFKVFFGSTFTSKVMPYADVIKSLSAESQTGGTLDNFDQYTGWFFTKLSISASASDTTPVKGSLTGVAKTGTLDANTTLATSITAATAVDPYVFADATLTVAASATAVMQGSFDISRAVDPLMLWGSRTPREFIPGEVTGTGSITVPYDDQTQSTIVTGFTDAALVFRFANVANTSFRTFTFPKAKLTDISRPIATRGGIMQVITIEPYYDPGTSTLVTLTTD